MYAYLCIYLHLNRHILVISNSKRLKGSFHTHFDTLLHPVAPPPMAGPHVAELSGALCDIAGGRVDKSLQYTSYVDKGRESSPLLAPSLILQKSFWEASSLTHPHACGGHTADCG